MSANISVSLKSVCRLAEALFLPLPEPDPKNPEFAILTAKEVRRWIEWEDGWNDIPNELYLIKLVMQSDASSYIYQKTQRADQLNLKGFERKNFLRKATKEYRLIFA